MLYTVQVHKNQNDDTWLFTRICEVGRTTPSLSVNKNTRSAEGKSSKTWEEKNTETGNICKNLHCNPSDLLFQTFYDALQGMWVMRIYPLGHIVASIQLGFRLIKWLKARQVKIHSNIWHVDKLTNVWLHKCHVSLAVIPKRICFSKYNWLSK